MMSLPLALVLRGDIGCVLFWNMEKEAHPRQKRIGSTKRTSLDASPEEHRRKATKIFKIKVTY